MLCRHCQETNANRPRGLCWTCYYQPDVRERYGPVSKYGRRGLGNFNGNTGLPAFPTTALPGSAEKIAILEQRARLRQSLFHPEDATLLRVPELTQAG